MKTLITAILAGLLTAAAGIDRAPAEESPAPSTLAGFTLQESIEQYGLKDHHHFLNEIIVTDLEGFRKGFITYGTCDKPGKIVRIKMKYEDRSYKFFNTLLDLYKEKFGKKPEFSGDTFGNVKSWKWAFTGKDGQRISLTLQHNLRDADESIGNTVKLSLPDQIIAERECLNKKQFGESSQKARSKETDWDILLPD